MVDADFSAFSERAHVAQNALGAVGARLVRVTTTLALAVDVFAFAVRQILQQILHSALAPVGQFGGRSDSFDLLDDRFSNEFGPVAVGAVQIGDRANFGATRAIFGAASFLVHVDVEASVGLLAFAATNTEAAHAAFVGDSETSGRRHDVGDFALVVQFAMIFETVDDIRNREPQALAPIVRFAESGASLFFSLDAFGTFVVRVVRVAATFATSVLFDAVAFGHQFQKFLVRLTTPIGNVRAESASFERFGEHAPTATDDWSGRHVANLTEFRARSLFAVDRQASFLTFAIAATEFETALTAFLGHDETSRH